MPNEGRFKSGCARGAAVGAVAVVALLGGCTKMQDVVIPGFDGPATYAVNLDLKANPDQLLADGHQTAVVVITTRDTAGQPLANREIALAIQDSDGYLAAIGTLSTSSVRTGSDGRAQAIYTAPLRHEQQVNQSVWIVGRAVSDDASGNVSKTVQINLISPEDRTFPPKNDGTPPVCGFNIEPPTGPYFAGVFYKLYTTSYEPPHDDGNGNSVPGKIVRYLWVFDDGVTEDTPDVYHVWVAPGDYNVVHTVTDDDGQTASCSLAITVE